MNIEKRAYSKLVDFPKVYQFMLRNYTSDWANGFPAVFYEYAQLSYWTDYLSTHRNAIWEDNGEVVAFCFYEDKIGKAYFNTTPAYEFLIPDMIKHAEDMLFDDSGKLELIISNSHKAVIAEAEKLGYAKCKEHKMGIYDYSKAPLDFPLPEGFSFVPPGENDIIKTGEAIWRGFDHEDEFGGGDWFRSHHLAAPRVTPELDVVIQNSEGDYVCCAGMWFIPENNLAYLEPLSTVPKYRRLGLASAALSELYRRTSKLGATHMTGGSNKFYFDIGFEPLVINGVWKK